MAVPVNTRYTAYGLGIGSGIVCTGSCIAVAKSDNTTHAVFFGLLGLVSGAFTVGCGTAFMRADPTTTPRKFIQEASSDAGYAGYAMTTYIAQEAGRAVIDKGTKALGTAVEKKVDAFFNDKKSDDEKK